MVFYVCQIQEQYNFNVFVQDVVQTGKRSKNTRGRETLLERTCKTDEPYRCKDNSYNKITIHRQYDKDIEINSKVIYDGNCIDHSQICDLNKDCLYGDDESLACSKDPGTK